MSLALGARLGDVFQIDNHTVKLISVLKATQATLELNDGRRVDVYANRLTEVLPNVLIGVGLDKTNHHLRLIFDAPRSIAITRSK
jgi:hypothetical protein